MDYYLSYEFFLKKNIKSGFYNAGFENLKVIDIAKMIQKKTGANIKIFKSNDTSSCLKAFKSNNIFGLIIFCNILILKNL